MENHLINQYFDEIESSLLNSVIVDSYTVIRKDVSDFAGKIRIRVLLINEDLIDSFEYVIINSGEIITKKYHIHWQDKEANLKNRWDNAPHHKELQNFPHHVHSHDNIKPFKGTKIPNFLLILKKIEIDFK